MSTEFARARRRCPFPAGQAGFTLIEVLVAISVFAIIAALSFAALSQYIRVSEGLEARQQQITRIQTAISRLERDMRYAVDRTVRAEVGWAEPGLVVDNPYGLDGEFIRVTTVEPDFRHPGAGRVQRVAWHIDSGVLYRSAWPVLDWSSPPEVTPAVMLDDVSTSVVQLFLWTRELGLQPFSPIGNEDQFPSGVSVTLEFDSGASLTRTFDLVNGS